MAFFDDLGKKLSQAGQTAVQKTKDITEIARLNGMISDEEKKTLNNYCEIGKLYMALHRDDCESDFAGLVAAIIDSEGKIKTYKQQIQDIKGVTRCPKCGAEVANNVAFCSTCGSAMPVQAPAAVSANTVKCAGCGADLAPGSRFCTGCGTPVEVAAPKACPTCGVPVADGVAFCTSCGTKLN